MKSQTLSIILVIGFIVICATSGIADNFDWPRWRGPNGDGISQETDWNPEALNGGPKILWKKDIGLGHSNVAFKDNRLYTSGGNTLYCLNTETGEMIWQNSLKQFADFYSTPTIDGKYVYTISRKGVLFCVKAKNGTIRWERELVDEFETEEIIWGYCSSPVIEGDLIILNINTAGVGLDKKTGELIWKSTVHTDKINSEGYHATPVLYNFEGKRCALLFSGAGLSSVNVKTGEKLWYYEWFDPSTTNTADPIVTEYRVFISNKSAVLGGVMLDISGEKPTVVWKNKNIKNHFSSSVLVDGHIYGCKAPVERYDKLRCAEWKTGDIVWEREMRGVSLISANGKLIMLNENGILYIAKATPSSYQEISSCDVLEGERKQRQFWTPPVLYRGKIYCRNFHGDLVCIDVSK